MRGEGVFNLGTRVYFKPTDTHALFHKSSYHPKHTFRGIVKSQLIRFKRICTAEEDVESATRTLFKVLRSRGYGRTFLRNIRTEVRGSPRQELRPARKEGPQHLVPFVSTFSPASRRLNSNIKNNFLKVQDVMEPLNNYL